MKKLALLTKPFVLFLFLGTFSVTAQAPFDIRVALVIGNSSYNEVPGLVNPQNDAKAMSFILKKLGFQVISVIDGTKKDIDTAIQNMKSNIRGREAVAMIYYAGHGLQHNWDNYIIPIDFKTSSKINLEKDAVNLKNILDVFSQSKTRMNIIVLDACRDNPFGSKLGSNKGLAQVDAPINTYIAFATAPGNVAQDGDERSGYGLFTGYLIKELQRPAPIEDVFKRVRLQVRKSSGGMQIPWDSSSLESDFAFNDGKSFTVTQDQFFKEYSEIKQSEEKKKKELAQAQLKKQQLIQEQEQEKLTKIIEIENKKQREIIEANINEERIKQQVIEQANKLKADEEIRRLSKNNEKESEKSDWEKIKDSKSVDDFYTFLYKYPNGLLSANANFKLEELDKRKITAQKDKNGIPETLGIYSPKIGDQLIYSVENRKALFSRPITVTIKVMRIEKELVFLDVNGQEGIRTISGGAIKSPWVDKTFSFDPPRQDLPGEPLYVGKKWSSYSSQSILGVGRLQKRTDNFKVVLIETISTPAGTFQTFKIEMNAKNDSSTINQIHWIDIETGMRVKALRKVYGPSPVDETTLLVNFKRG
jgi:uncharacterized caspase-like protein